MWKKKPTKTFQYFLKAERTIEKVQINCPDMKQSKVDGHFLSYCISEFTLKCFQASTIRTILRTAFDILHLFGPAVEVFNVIGSIFKSEKLGII